MKQSFGIFSSVLTSLMIIISLCYSLEIFSLPTVPLDSFSTKFLSFLIVIIPASYLLGRVNKRINSELKWPMDVTLMIIAAAVFAWIAVFIIHWLFMGSVIPTTDAAHQEFVNYCLIASLLGVGITFAALYRSISVTFVVSFLGIFVMGHMIVAVLYFEGLLF